MLTNRLTTIWFRRVTVASNARGFSETSLQSNEPPLSERDVTEIKIPVPWGHIAGKWWGRRDRTPIIATHGWQDNANTFDKLVPLLNDCSVLAIDFPGHGLSSHFPPGRPYFFLDYVLALNRVIHHLNIDRASLMGHSLGSAASFIYSAVYPERVKCYISIDCARTLLMQFKEDITSNLRSYIDRQLQIEDQSERPAPSNKLSHLVKSYSHGSVFSLLPESSLILMRRNIVSAASRTEEKEITYRTDLGEIVKKENERAKKGKVDMSKMQKFMAHRKRVMEKIETFKLDEPDEYYSISRDYRVKINGFDAFNAETVISAAKHIKCPTLSIRGDAGFLNSIGSEVYEETLDILSKGASYFEHHDLEGSHHLHLNNSEIVAPVVNKFLKKFC